MTTSRQDPFEVALSRALEGYADRAPVEVDAVAMTAAVAGARGVGRASTRWTRQRWLVPVLLGLLVALIGAALVAGGLVRLPSILQRPATADDLLFLMDMRRDPQDHVCADVRRIAVATGARRQIISCADQIEFTHDGSRAAVGGLTGLTIVDTNDGSTLADLPTGVWTRPVGWSPSGRWIQTAECTPWPEDICRLVIVAADGSTRNEIPNDAGGKGGGYVPAGWAPDESRMYVQGQEADPDGSDVRPVPVDDPIGNVDSLENWVRSPDGTPASVAYTQEDRIVWVRTRTDPGGRELTTIPEGHAIRTLAWSPDGRTIAAIEYVRSADLSAPPPPVTPDALRLIDVATGASRILQTPQLHHRQRDGFELAWSPDGRRLAVTMGNGEPDGSNDRFSRSFDTVILTVDGSAPAVFLQDARGAVWSSDSRSIAYVKTTGSIMFHEGQPSSPPAIMVMDADGSAATTIVGPAEIVTPLGEPSSWFLWAVAD
jgi:dipeptidyl aminopeptidase/acylaminoacyl peptidase